MTINPPELGVSVLVRHEGKVLLIKRGRPPFEGLWALPGGHVEAGETLREAAIREVFEETGIAVDGLTQIDFAEIATAAGATGTGRKFMLVVFAGKYKGGNLAAADDAADARWVAGAALEALPITKETERVLASHGDKGAGRRG